MARLALAAVTLALLGCAGTASAQTAAPPTSLDGKPGTLSDKLGDTGGVIHPEGNVDPAMHKATPPTGTMPVIKPGQVPPQTGQQGAPDQGGGLR